MLAEGTMTLLDLRDGVCGTGHSVTLLLQESPKAAVLEEGLLLGPNC